MTRHMGVAFALLALAPGLAPAAEVKIVVKIAGVAFVARADGEDTLRGRVVFAGDKVEIRSGYVVGSEVFLTGVITDAHNPDVIGETVDIYADARTGRVIVSTSFGFEEESVGKVTIG